MSHAYDTRRSRIIPGDGDPRHGTTNGYSNLSCRCVSCRGAFAGATRRARAERKARLDSATVEHGKNSTYCNWLCRCRPCLDAHARQRAQQLARQRAYTTTGG
jgi:hypothetical protein